MNDKVKQRHELRPASRYTPDVKSCRGSIPGIANGWCHTLDAAEYQRLASLVSNGNIIEIGSYEGLSLYHIKDICKANNAKLYCVDFIAWPKLVENCEAWGIPFINKPSVDAALDFPDDFFDLVYIDADHHKSECAWDIWAWLPKLKKTGTICGHDFDNKNVRRALKYVFGTIEPDVINVGGFVWSVTNPHEKVKCWPEQAKYNDAK